MDQAGLVSQMLPSVGAVLGGAGWGVIALAFASSVVVAFGLGRLTARQREARRSG